MNASDRAAKLTASLDELAQRYADRMVAMLEGEMSRNVAVRRMDALTTAGHKLGGVAGWQAAIARNETIQNLSK